MPTTRLRPHNTPRFGAGRRALVYSAHSIDHRLNALFPQLHHEVSFGGLPAFWLGVFITAPNVRALPASELATKLLTLVPVYVMSFVPLAVIYGYLLWLFLRSIGLFLLPVILFASALPVLIYYCYWALQGAWDSRLVIGSAFWFLPALTIGASLWWLGTVRS